MSRSRVVTNKKKNKLLLFILASLLLHVLLFLFVSVYSVILQPLVNQDKPTFVEITDLPKQKETAPPKETKRLAEQSHQAPVEKKKDDFSKRGIAAMPAQPPKGIPKQQQAKAEAPKEKARKQKAEKREKAKKEKSVEKAPQIASLPKDTFKNIQTPKETAPREREKSDNITKEDLFRASSAAGQSSSGQQRAQAGQQGFEGARDGKREDTVDLSTTEFKYMSYFLKLKRQIEGVWNYPEISRVRGEQGELLLIFSIRRDGRLDGIKLLTSSGYVRLDDEALRAIKVAAPFPPFPDQWAGLERLNIRAIFSYEMRWSIR